jgi:hypothetical protein
VRKCEQSHGLSSASDAEWRTSPKQLGEVSNRTRVFQFCEWPSPPGADPDGYSEISMRFAEGPGESESSWPSAYRITSPNCQTFAVVVAGYNNVTGDVELLPAFLVSADEVKTVEDEVWQDDAESFPLPFYRRSDEAIILSNGHFGLDRITCQEQSSLDGQSSGGASGSETSPTATVEDAPPQALVPVEESPSAQTTACGLLKAGTALLDVRVSNIDCRAARGLLSRATLASVREGRTRWSYRGWDWTLRPRDEASAKISGTNGTATIKGVWGVF